MKRRIRRNLRLVLQAVIWLLVLFLGISIIVKGTRIIYGEAFGKLAEDTFNRVGKQMGVSLIKKYGAVFSYFYEDKEEKDNLEEFAGRIYLWHGDIYEKQISYPIEDSLYEEILAKLLLENKFEENSTLYNDIPIVSYLPGNAEIEENEKTESTSEDEGVATMLPVTAPDIIGNEYSIAQLSDFDFLLRRFYAVESNTTVNSSIINVSKMLSKDMSLEVKNSGNPQILIYHTHSTEGYKDSREGVIEDTVVGMGEYLAEILERDYGYKVLHVTTAFDCINGKVDRSAAYAYAEDALEGILASYPDIEVIIDLHRDGLDEGVHLVTEYNGKKAAKIMFVNGISRMENSSISYLYNPYISDNLAFSFQLQLKGEAYFPELMRRIIIKAYRYNLHFEERSVLVELGAQTNTVEEARNAVELLAIMLGEVLR